MGNCLEIEVKPETMRYVLSLCKQTPKYIAMRVFESEWILEQWQKETHKIPQWKLMVIAQLTRKFNWAIFLLEPKNLPKSAK